jgi:transposase-like protein
MRLSAQEKKEIIHLVDRSDLGVNRTLKELGIHKSTFYKWYKVYQTKRPDWSSATEKNPPAMELYSRRAKAACSRNGT